MRFGKVIFAVCVFAFVFSPIQIRAQDAKSPQQIKILNNYGAIPFESGKTVIAEIEFTGLDNEYEQNNKASGILILERDLLRLLKENRATINVNDNFYGYKISIAVKIFKQWLSSKGYVKAEVVALGEKLPNNRMRLVFEIKRGAPVRVSEILFEGNVNVTDEELLADFKQCVGNDWEIFDEKLYTYITRKCSISLFFSKGFFQAKIRQVTPKLVADNYVVTIRVEEGVRYRIGEIKIEGAKVFSEEKILELLGQKTGDIADGGRLQEFVYEKLKRNYVDRGYILYNAEFEPEFIQPVAEGLDATVNISIFIDEGREFRLSRIIFTSVNKKKELELRRLLGLREGDVFNQTKFEEGIKRINDLEELYFIDHDRDVEIRTSEDGGEIDLIIKTQKRYNDQTDY